MMIDVLEEDVSGLSGRLRRERFVVPVLACGISAPAGARWRRSARGRARLCAYWRRLIAATIASVVGARRSARIGGHPVLDRAMLAATVTAPSSARALVTGRRGQQQEMMARRFTAFPAGGSDRLGQMRRRRRRRARIPSCSGARPMPFRAARRIEDIEGARDGTIFLRRSGHAAPATQARLLAALIELPPAGRRRGRCPSAHG